MTNNDDNRPFPIQAGSYRGEDGKMKHPKRCVIPWWLAEEAYEHYVRVVGKGCQSLEKLAYRGGFGRNELLMLLRREEL